MIEAQERSNARAWESSILAGNPTFAGFNPSGSGIMLPNGGVVQYDEALFSKVRPDLTWSIDDVRTYGYDNSLEKSQEGRSFQQYLEGDTSPWVVSADGQSVSYSPTKQQSRVMPKSEGAIAGLKAFLTESPGLYPVFIAAGVAGAQAAFGGAAAGAESGLGAINSFDSGAMASILGTDVASSAATVAAGSTLTLPSASTGAAALSTLKTGAEVAKSVGAITSSALLIDSAVSGTKPSTGAPVAPAQNPIFLTLGGQDTMATASKQTAQPASATATAKSFDWQSLLPLAVLVVVVVALSDELKG